MGCGRPYAAERAARPPPPHEGGAFSSRPRPPHEGSAADGLEAPPHGRPAATLLVPRVVAGRPGAEGAASDARYLQITRPLGEGSPLSP